MLSGALALVLKTVVYESSISRFTLLNCIRSRVSQWKPSSHYFSTHFVSQTGDLGSEAFKGGSTQEAFCIDQQKEGDDVRQEEFHMQ